MPLTGLFVVLVVLAFWGYCLVDFARTDDRDLQMFSRPVWAILLVFTSLFGALLWFFKGRPRPNG